MKFNAKSKIIILITLGILFALLPMSPYNISSITGNNSNSSEFSNEIAFNNENLMIAVTSGKIHIDNNWTDAKVAGICTGNGIFSDPYIIDNLENGYSTQVYNYTDFHFSMKKIFLPIIINS